MLRHIVGLSKVNLFASPDSEVKRSRWYKPNGADNAVGRGRAETSSILYER